MRPIKFTSGEYYHLLNRGVDKKNIFKDKNDYLRFLFLVLYCQSPVTFNNVGYITRVFKKTDCFSVSEKTIREIIDRRYIKLIAFSLMPNHFHLLIQAENDDGVSQYMQRIQNAYTKYFNAKYKISGHLFQGPFRARHIQDNDQLLYVSAYIHRNCVELENWKNRPVDYPWASLIDYVKTNRWPKLLDPEIILDQFSSLKEYENWVAESVAKNYQTLGV